MNRVAATTTPGGTGGFCTRVRFVYVVAVVACLSAPQARAEAASAEQVLSCDLARGRLVHAASLGGRSGFVAVLDAGLAVPVVSHQALSVLGIVADAAGAAALGGFELAPGLRHEGRAAAGDLAALSEAIGQNVDAIAPLYQPGLEVTLDAAQGRVAYRPMALALLGATGDGVLPLRLRDGVVPVVQVLLAGRFQRELELDLGYPGFAAFSQGTLQSLGTLANDPPALRTLGPGAKASVQFRLPVLQVGGTTFEGAIGEMAEGADRLGLEALRHFELTLNYEAGLVRFRANAGSVIPAVALVGYGLTLARFHAGQWELGVAEGSPAAEAGIAPGDVLAEVGGVPVRSTDAATVGRLLRAVEGQEAQIGIIHAGAPHTLTLVARALL